MIRLPRPGYYRLLPGLATLLAASVLAGNPVRVPPEMLESIADDEPIVPKSLTIEEQGRWYIPDLSRLAQFPPSPGDLVTPAEYQGNDGLLLRWGQFNSVVTEITVAVSTGEDHGAVIYLIVSGPSQQASAESVLDSAGADLDRVEFLQMPSDTVWIRDYGPRFIHTGFQRSIVDHTYNRPRPNDNQVPANVAVAFNEPIYDLPLVHGGGNFHLFANNDAYMTELILNENPGYSEQDVIDLYDEYHALNLTILPPLPSSFDSTQHLDMWFFPVDDQAVIIGEYDESEAGGVPHDVSESTADLMDGRGYTVYRTPGWSSFGTHYTYTNSIVINSLVLICRFNGYPDENAQAEAVYQIAYPDHTVVSIDCSGIITAAGAIHCIVKHVASGPEILFRDSFQALPARKH